MSLVRVQLPPMRSPALSPSEPEALDSEADNDEDDREALEAFDREN